jgi:hypothetical protein
MRCSSVRIASRVAFAPVALVVCATPAVADWRSFAIESLYSNADGSVQYVVLHETQGAAGGNLLSGRTLTATHAGIGKTYAFPNDLTSAATGNRRVLIATAGFAAASPIAPDYRMPDRFLPVDGGTLDYAGVDALAFAALPVDGVNALQRSGTTAPNVATNFAGETYAVPASAVAAVEFYHDALDHYFLSPLAPDIDALDSGRIAGWSRTGYTFAAFPTSAAAGAIAVSPVCRFYIPPQHGDSHFLSAFGDECQVVLGKIGSDPNYTGYVYETPAAFFVATPDRLTGACAAGAPVAVYRFWNGRADSNHRYVTGDATRAQMLARGHVPEGYGPSGAAMCATAAAIGDSRVRVTGASPFTGGCDGTPATGVLYAGAEVEPMIAVAPANPDHLVGVWQQDRWSDGGAAGLRTGFSFDAGRSWTAAQARFSRCTGGTADNGGDYARASDPWVAIAPDGTAFQSAIAFNGATFGAGSASAVLVSRSSDGGRTWSDAVTLIRDGSDAFNDKQSLTADRYRPGHVYATWDRIVPAGTGPTWFSRTTDNGATWEPARPIFEPGSRSQTINNQIVALPAVAPAPGHGIVDFFTQIDTAPDNALTSRLALVGSPDRGTTWSAPVYVATLQAIGTRDPELGTRLRDGANLASVAGGTNGVLAAVWQDARFSGGARDGVAFARSNDGGLTWTAPVQVNSVPDAPALLPTVTIRDDGTFGVLYYDLRSNTGAPSLLVDVWLATSSDGVAWQESHVAGPFDFRNAPLAGGGLFLGDYQALASAGAAFYPFVAIANADGANRSDVFASALRSVAAAPAAAAKRYRAEGAPALVPDDALRRELDARTRLTLRWRRVGGDAGFDAAPPY